MYFLSVYFLVEEAMKLGINTKTNDCQKGTHLKVIDTTRSLGYLRVMANKTKKSTKQKVFVLTAVTESDGNL